MLRIWDLFNTINFPLCSILAASHIFQYVAFSLGSKCFLSFLMASPLTRRLFINTLSFKPSAGWSSPFKAFAVLVEFSTARSSKWALALLVLILEAARGASSDTQGARNSVFGCFFFFFLFCHAKPQAVRGWQPQAWQAPTIVREVSVLFPQRSRDATRVRRAPDASSPRPPGHTCRKCAPLVW